MSIHFGAMHRIIFKDPSGQIIKNKAGGAPSFIARNVLLNELVSSDQLSLSQNGLKLGKDGMNLAIGGQLSFVEIPKPLADFMAEHRRQKTKPSREEILKFAEQISTDNSEAEDILMLFTDEPPDKPHGSKATKKSQESDIAAPELYYLHGHKLEDLVVQMLDEPSHQELVLPAGLEPEEENDKDPDEDPISFFLEGNGKDDFTFQADKPEIPGIIPVAGRRFEIRRGEDQDKEDSPAPKIIGRFDGPEIAALQAILDEQDRTQEQEILESLASLENPAGGYSPAEAENIQESLESAEHTQSPNIHPGNGKIEFEESPGLRDDESTKMKDVYGSGGNSSIIWQSTFNPNKNN